MSKTFLEALTSVGKNLKTEIAELEVALNDKVDNSTIESTVSNAITNNATINKLDNNFKKVFTNLTTNGDLRGWTQMGNDSCALSFSSNIATITLNTNDTMMFALKNTTEVAIDTTHLYYVSAFVNVENADNCRSVYLSIDGNTASAQNKTGEVLSPNAGVWYHLSGIVQPKPSVAGNVRLRVCFMRDSLSDTYNTEKMQIKQLRIIDLTYTYGVGNEPPKEFMDRLINGEEILTDTIITASLGTLESSYLYSSEISKNSQVGYVNVKEKYQLDNTGVLDVSDKIDEIFENEPEYTTLYFPDGKYLVSRGFVIPKSFTIIGEMGSDIEWCGTRFVIADGTSNITLFSDIEGNWDRINYKNFAILSTSFTYSQNTSIVSQNGDVKDKYSYSIVNENVNGIKMCFGGSYADNVRFYGLSGTALNTYVFNYVTNCYAERCYKPFVIKTDNSVLNLRTQWCYQGYEITGTANSVNNIRCDGIATYGLIVRKDGNSIENVCFDQVNWAGVYITGASSVRVTGNLGRCAQYYADFERSNVPIEDSYKAAHIYIENSQFVQFDCLSGYAQIIDTSTPDAKAPVYKIVSAGTCNNIDARFTGNSKTTYSNGLDVHSALDSEIIEELLCVMSGTFSGYISFNGKQIKIKRGTSDNLSYVSCDNVYCYNTTDITTLTPKYVGQLITYNNALYIGVSLTTGGWLNLTSLKN